jgi:hypothetical protein
MSTGRFGERGVGSSGPIALGAGSASGTIWGRIPRRCAQAAGRVLRLCRAAWTITRRRTSSASVGSISGSSGPPERSPPGLRSWRANDWLCPAYRENRSWQKLIELAAQNSASEPLACGLAALPAELRRGMAGPAQILPRQRGDWRQHVRIAGKRNARWQPGTGARAAERPGPRSRKSHRLPARARPDVGVAAPDRRAGCA